MFNQFSGGIYGGSDNVALDENEFQQHQKLEKLYISIRVDCQILRLLNEIIFM